MTETISHNETRGRNVTENFRWFMIRYSERSKKTNCKLCPLKPILIHLNWFEHAQHTNIYRRQVRYRYAHYAIRSSINIHLEFCTLYKMLSIINTLQDALNIVYEYCAVCPSIIINNLLFQVSKNIFPIWSEKCDFDMSSVPVKKVDNYRSSYLVMGSHAEALRRRGQVKWRYLSLESVTWLVFLTENFSCASSCDFYPLEKSRAILNLTMKIKILYINVHCLVYNS